MQKAQEAEAGVLDYAVPEGRSKEQSRWGVWAVNAGTFWFLAAAYFVVLGITGRPLTWVHMAVAGGAVLAAVLAVILGIVGVVQKTRSRKLAIVGLVWGCGALLLMLLSVA